MANTEIDYPRGITFEQVWAALMENREQIRETERIIKETQRETAQSQKETERIIKETQREIAQSQKETARSQKETDRQMKETDKKLKQIGKRFGDFTNSFGEIVEYMVAPNLQDRFYELGLDFQEVANDIKILDKKNNIFFQVDVYLQNCDTAMLVEVKADLTISDINKHIKRIEKMREYADLRGDKRTFLGAVAGVVIKPKVREYALSRGFYLAEPSGETFNITPPHNQPKEW